MRRDPAPIREMAERARAAGANVIDINAGPLSRDPQGTMSFLVRAVEDAAPLPVCLDTANPVAMEAGLAAARNGRAVVNGVSLEPAKFDAIAPIAARHGALVVAYLLRADGLVPPDAAGRLAAAAELFARLTDAGVAPERILFDPVCPPLIWQDGPAQAREVLETVRLLPEVLGYPARTLVGLSNLTTGAGPRDKKILLQSAFLSMLAAQGLTAVLLDTDLTPVVQAARAASLLQSGSVFCWESL